MGPEVKCRVFIDFSISMAIYEDCIRCQRFPYISGVDRFSYISSWMVGLAGWAGWLAGWLAGWAGWLLAGCWLLAADQEDDEE